jgi:hypothetical protein
MEQVWQLMATRAQVVSAINVKWRRFLSYQLLGAAKNNADIRRGSSDAS